MTTAKDFLRWLLYEEQPCWPTPAWVSRTIIIYLFAALSGTIIFLIYASIVAGLGYLGLV